MKKHLILSFFLLLFIESIKAQPKINDLTSADYESQVSKADLNYTTPVIQAKKEFLLVMDVWELLFGRHPMPCIFK